MKNNQDVVLAAVRQDGNTLQFASYEMKNNQDVVLAAVQHTLCTDSLLYVGKSIKNNLIIGNTMVL